MADKENVVQAELKGNLQFMSLGTLISINCNENRTARIDIDNKSTHAEIYIQNGNIVHAIIDTQIGEDAFYKILTLREGTFGIYPDELAPQISIEKIWSTLLLEGTRRMDESSIGEDQKIDWANFIVTESDVEQMEKIIDERISRMVKALRRLNGVSGVTVVSHDAKVLENDAEYDATEYASHSNALLATAQKLGSYVGVNYFKDALINSSHNVIVVNRGQDSIMLLSAKNVTTELLLNEIYNIIKRYR